ncbi:MAG: hypothetical protein WBN40_13110 [Pseudomonadales bacterium]
MKAFFISSWRSVMDSRYNPLQFMDISSQFYYMVVLAWMWSMVFSISFLSIFQFQVVWLAHLLVIAAIFATVLVFRHAENQAKPSIALSTSNDDEKRCVWKLDSEA